MKKNATKYAQSLIPYAQKILNFHKSNQIYFCNQSCWKSSSPFPLNYPGWAWLSVCIKGHQGEGAGIIRNAHSNDLLSQFFPQVNIG